MKKLILFLLFAFCITPAFARIDTTRHTIEHDDLERTYELHVPESLGEDVPLVIALHQFSSNARTMQLLTDLNTLADEMGLIVAYPETTHFGWNNGTADIGRGYFGQDVENPDDLGFILAMMDELFDTYPIDPEQVYVVGGENGGLMASYMACQMPEKFAGVVSVEATMWEYQDDICPEESRGPVDILFMLGSLDWFYPFNGRNLQLTPDRPVRYTASFQKTMEWWAVNNGCDPTSVVFLSDTSHAYFTDCESDVRTYLYIVNGGGGAWFGDYNVAPIGITTEAVLKAFINGDALEDFPPQDKSVVSDDPLPRSYRLYVPTGYDPDEPMPIVVALHGRPDSGTGFSIITQLHLTAERENFMVLYPDGLNLGWNSTQGVPGYNNGDWDDVQFLEDLVLHLDKRLNIDLNRVYATGFSNGGFMVQRLACSAPDFFAAYAVLGATMVRAFIPLCDSENPVPIMFMHGTNDVSIHWQGEPNSYMPVVDSLYYWVNFNDCNLTPLEPEMIPKQDEDAETFVAKIVYEDCAFGGDMWFYGVQNGGHNWTGVPGVIREEIAGLVNTDIHASDVVWAYMSQYTLDR